jgi:phospholipase C
MRVPMLVISPWSTGGWVNSEVFDHTSLIRFIQARFGRAELSENNITPWRAAVAGDLTSAFNFGHCAASEIPWPGVASYVAWVLTTTRRRLFGRPEGETGITVTSSVTTKTKCPLHTGARTSTHSDP